MITKEDVKKLQYFQNNVNKDYFIKAFLMLSYKQKGKDAVFLAEKIWNLYIENHRNLIEVINYLDDDALDILINLINHLDKFR